MTVQAKMKCSAVSGAEDAPKQVTLHAVYSADPADENYSYSQATPWAELRMAITNPAAYGYFEPGATYRVSFERVDVAAAGKAEAA